MPIATTPTSCDAAVVDCALPPAQLANRVPVSGQDGDMGGRQFRYVAEAGRQLSIITHGGTGNVSLFVRYGGEASATVHEQRSTRPGNHETVRIAAPRAGTYHITLAGDPSFAGVTLQVLQ